MRRAMTEGLPWRVESSIDRFFRTGEPRLEIVGTDSIALLGALLGLPRVHLGERPHLVIVPSVSAAQQLGISLKFFNPDVKSWVLPAFDTDVYSGLYPNRRLISERLRWLARAQSALPGDIFIAPLESLIQYTLPFEILAQNIFRVRKGAELPQGLALTLDRLGYSSTPVVEDVGHYAIRGGIVDIYSPAMDNPVRLELFGDLIDSVRAFDPTSQRSGEEMSELVIIPAQEILYSDENRQRAAKKLKDSWKDREVDEDESQALLQSLVKEQHFHGVEYLISYFYENPTVPMEHFSTPLTVWRHDPLEADRVFDEFSSRLRDDFRENSKLLIRPDAQEVYASASRIEPLPDSQTIVLTKVRVDNFNEEFDAETPRPLLPLSTSDLRELSSTTRTLAARASDLAEFLNKKIHEWRNSQQRVFFSVNTQSQAQRLRLILQNSDLEAVILPEMETAWATWLEEQDANRNRVHILQRSLPESLRYPEEHIIFLREEDLFGGKKTRPAPKGREALGQRAEALAFGDLKPGDLIVHKTHGIGVFDGLKVMPIQGVDAEFIQIKYKDNDRLYLPVYRVHLIQKYSGPQAPALIDKLGGSSWEKTKTKVRSHLRDIAAELLDIYAKRAVVHRPPFSPPDNDYYAFEATFPYQETDDQLRAISDILEDLQKDKPMDRLICGDVGYGKTEVAMRAAFKTVEDKKQVAVIAPTTVLTFQHLETFKKRFAKWPIVIRSLNRFVPKKELQQTLAELKEGKVDIVIGTHRLLSADVQFKNLGLMIVDEEQRFGVKHKERLRKIRVDLDTMAMSATPIPRTLNMSLVGIRDLSLINTAPVDRLPTRTFVCKFDKDTIRKAILSEVSRGGQVYFIHNRIQSIYHLADQLREIVPEVRFKVAHGQMEEGELEKVMVEFFHHEIDMLICTTIVESGMDVTSANTMFIDNAQALGLSQLYQLRGRVGRSKERAYCYLLVPNHQKIDKEAQERLRIIQENTALGSGIRIAQYDLELRGAGDILGEDQAGQINAVGYELYLELLNEAVANARGQDVEEGVEPEINVRIPALIPDAYIPDLRIRLAYYKSLTNIQSPEDLDRIEDELRDQFGPLPEQVLNLMGLMLIRAVLKELRARDLSSSESSITIAFTEKTPLPPSRVIELASRSNKKYSITPDNRLRVRMNEISWPRIFEELQYLKSLT